MDRRVVFLLCLSIWGVVGKVDHPELRGEHPNQEDIDNGQCVPIPCNFGVPVRECKDLCEACNYETICQPPGDFCLCRHTVNGKDTLFSPDEVKCPAPEPPEVDGSETSEPTSDMSGSSKVYEETSMPENGGYISFQIFAVLHPIKQYLYESINEEDPSPQRINSANLGYEPVNVHEGRLFWDFRYILTGLLLLMVALVLYELFMCAFQYYGPKDDLPVKCEIPEVKIHPGFYSNEKILKV